DHDHFALRLRKTALFLHHRIVIREERAELVGPVGKRQEHVRHETRFLLYGENPRAHVVGQALQLGNRETADRMCSGLPGHETPSSLRAYWIECRCEYRPPRTSRSRCEPTSMMRPASSTTIRSARSIVDRRCATTNVVRLRISRSSDCWMKRSDSESSAD